METQEVPIQPTLRADAPSPPSTVVVRTLAEDDLPEAQRIVRLAFGTFLGAPDPEGFWSDRD